MQDTGQCDGIAACDHERLKLDEVAHGAAIGFSRIQYFFNNFYRGFMAVVIIKLISWSDIDLVDVSRYIEKFFIVNRVNEKSIRSRMRVAANQSIIMRQK